MKVELEKRCSLAIYRHDLSERITGFTQRYLSVADYLDEFDTLSS